MTWINSLLEDETIFPSKIGVQFPPNFRDIAHRIMRRLFRIYAHIYCRHLQEKVQTANERKVVIVRQKILIQV